jgi:hypothetical protein
MSRRKRRGMDVFFFFFSNCRHRRSESAPIFSTSPLSLSLPKKKQPHHSSPSPERGMNKNVKVGKGEEMKEGSE